MKIFEKEYNSESLTQDIEGDVFDAFDPLLNGVILAVPQDEYGFYKGTFKVTIEWIDE